MFEQKGADHVGQCAGPRTSWKEALQLHFYGPPRAETLRRFLLQGRRHQKGNPISGILIV